MDCTKFPGTFIVQDIVNDHYKKTGKVMTSVACHPSVLGQVAAEIVQRGIAIDSIIIDTHLPLHAIMPDPDPTDTFAATLREIKVLVPPDMLPLEALQ